MFKLYNFIRNLRFPTQVLLFIFKALVEIVDTKYKEASWLKFLLEKIIF